MSRQSKNRHKRAMAKSSKGHMTGKHYGENQARMKCPHQQPAPCWIKASGRKGWWSKKGVRREETQQNAPAGT